jgi:hypothetical protein
MKEVQIFRDEVIQTLESIARKGQQILDSRGKLEHISGPIFRTIEILRIVSIINDAKLKIAKRGGGKKWNQPTLPFMKK